MCAYWRYMCAHIVCHTHGTYTYDTWYIYICTMCTCGVAISYQAKAHSLATEVLCQLVPNNELE